MELVSDLDPDPHCTVPVRNVCESKTLHGFRHIATNFLGMNRISYRFLYPLFGFYRIWQVRYLIIENDGYPVKFAVFKKQRPETFFLWKKKKT